MKGEKGGLHPVEEESCDETDEYRETAEKVKIAGRDKDFEANI